MAYCGQNAELPDRTGTGRRRGYASIRAALCCCLLPACLAAAEFYVSPSGSAAGDGSRAQPWDLRTALSHPPAVKPMDTIWLLGGVYQGEFTSKLQGAKDAPIVVRQYPGERAILDGGENNKSVLEVNGGWAWYWGFEVRNSRRNRRIETPGSNVPAAPGHGLNILGGPVKVINVVVHDTGTAIGFWKTSVDSELYGNVIFNNGWFAPDGNHGHGIYTQNTTGTKLLRDNIVFNQFKNGLHLYGSPAAPLMNYRVEGNVIFNDSVQVGGEGPAENIELKDNCFYIGNAVRLYYSHKKNRNLSLSGNYFASLVQAFWWDRIRALGNTFFRYNNKGASLEIRLQEGGDPSQFEIDRNVYVSGPNNRNQIIVSDTASGYHEVFTIDQWREKFGYDRSGNNLVYPDGRPNAPVVFVRRNFYEPSRGHIIVYNWPRGDFVQADVSVMNLRKGDRYELRNVQNYLQESITGTYEGAPIRIPMKGWTMANPIGMDKPIEPATFPEFGAFVITVDRAARVTTRSAASFRPPPLAPDSIVSSFGEGLAQTTQTAAALPAPAELAGTAVRLVDSEGREHSAPLFFVAPTQLNYLLPAAAKTGPAMLQVKNGGTVVADEGLMLWTVAPGLFSANGDGSGAAAGEAMRIAADGTRTTVPLYRCGSQAGSCVPEPVDPGGPDEQTVLTFYGTGFRNHRDAGALTITIGGEPAPVLFAGPHPDLPGLDQINVLLPPTLAGRGTVDVVVSVENQASNAVTVAIL